eukprot:scaffold15515_cov54-Phaeocystis_antarctica.AAC.4
MLEEHESKVQRLAGRLADGQIVVPIDKDVHTVMGSTAGANPNPHLNPSPNPNPNTRARRDGLHRRLGRQQQQFHND